MTLFLMTIAITFAEIPAVIIRYLPFSEIISFAEKKKLLFYYTTFFIIQNSVLFFFLKDNYSSLTPLIYKQLIFLFSSINVIINILVIKGFFFKHLFVLGMQAGYSLFLHSIISMFLGQYAKKMPLQDQFLIQTICYIILFTVVTYFLWKRIAKSLIIKNIKAEGYYWNIIWLVPTLTVFSVAVVTMDEQWINSWTQVASRIFMILVIIFSWKCVNFDFQSLDKMQLLESMNRLLYIQKDSIQKQMDIIAYNEKSINVFKHDMRHNLQIILSLIEHGDGQEAVQLITKMNHSLESTKPMNFCKNTIINSVLLVYITKAQKNGIEVITKVHIPQDIPWSSSDIAILIANALENAFIASLKQEEDNRQIQITTTYEDKKLAISIKNKFHGDLIFDERGFPTSRELNHGIGIQSILSIVDRHKAYASCSHEDGWFSISFLFT